MWRVLYDSIRGTSHAAEDSACQDSNGVLRVVTPEGDALVIACSDGAGTAAYSDLGSRIACETVLQVAGEALQHSVDLRADFAATLFQAAAQKIHETARQMERPGRDFACTLLVAVLTSRQTVFAQVGDGAIVQRQGDDFTPVFWPQNGEYQNTTFFITADNYADRLQVHVVDDSVHEVAMLTDGLQMLALQYSDKSAHQAFFKPFFKALREAKDPDDLNVPFREFLSSEQVDARTDDDKTLIIALRIDSAQTV